MDYKKAINIVRVFTSVSILGLAIYVAVTPHIVYAPVSRVVLFLLVALLPSILFGVEAAAKFKLKLLGFVVTASGIAGFLLTLLFVFDYLAKPEEKIAVYEVVDESNNPVSLDFDGAINVSITKRGLSVTKFTDGNSIVLIFPEQVGQAEIHVKKAPSGSRYSGKVTYAGARTLKLRLGKELRLNQK